MNRINNIIFKFLFCLVLLIGWGGNVIAQGLGYKVVVVGDNSYQVTANASILNGTENVTVGNNGYLDLTDAAVANWYSDNRSISINCTDKFVWGPVLDTTAKTITYTIKQPVDISASANTPLTTEGWYQFQIVDYNNVNKINEINDNSAHKSNTIYLTNADVVHRQNGSNWYSVKFSGIARQNSEAQTFFYLSPSGNNPHVQASNGLHVMDNGCSATSIQNYAPFTAINALGGIYSVKRWTVWADNNNHASSEKPYMGASGTGVNFHVRAVKVNPTEIYDVYRVNIPGVTNSGELGTYAHATCTSNKIVGASVAYQGGYFFFPKGTELNWGMFSCNKFNGVDINISEPGADGIRTLTFTDNPAHDKNLISFSPAPTATGWAANTKWFTIRNNRSNQNEQYNRTFLTTSTNYVTAESNLKMLAKTMPAEQGSYWCFVGDNTNGFVIQNAAYGPHFVLGINGNTVRMVPKDDIPNGFTTTFTSVENAVKDGASHAYAFRLGLTGNRHIHVSNGAFLTYDHTAISSGDTGSAFQLTATPTAVVEALPGYDVYKVVTTGNVTVRYYGLRRVYSNREYSPYFILEKGEPEVAQTHIQTGREIEAFKVENPADTYMKLITIDLAMPVIKHRQSYLFDKLNSVTDDQLPGQGFIKKGDGMTKNPNTGDDIQYTSNYTITQYVKHGQSKSLFMPTIDGNSCEVTAYQRWYDYEHETMPRTDVINIPGYRAAAAMYKNGVVVGSNNSRGEIIKNAEANLPNGLTEYWLAVDQSRYNDGETEASENLIEPSLTMRVIYHLVDAKVMANNMNACTQSSAKWQEEHTISYPNRKLWNGDNATKSGVDYIGLNHEFSNYWCFDGSGTTDDNLEQMVSGKLLVELDPSSTANLQNVQILANGHGGISGVQGFARNRFIGFQYPLVNGKYEVPENSKAIIKVYMQNAAGTKFQLARINLTFIGSAEPLLITEVYGRDANGGFKNSRSMEAMTATYGTPVSELTFDHAQHIRFECPTAQGNYPKYSNEAYAFPLDFKQSSYGYHGAPWASRGEYIFRNGGSGIGGKTFYPVDSYKQVIDNGGSLAKQDNKYFLYVDASEQPGQVMSIPIPERLCSGSRMFCYGWFNSATQISQESVGIVLNIVGKVNANDETGDIIYSFNPGLLSTKAFDSNNQLVENVFGAAPWRQVGFSFLVNGENAGKYAAYELQVMNNCYSTNGGDFTLDNFYIFTTPPKGNVDFTTPLCSDKTRHAKIHADYDMLWEVNGVNETDPNAKLTASYCFLDAELFDNYEEDDLKIKDIFVMDEATGNHNLNPAYTLSQVEGIINRAFSKALVGRRCTSSAKDSQGNYYEDHGFHSYEISTNYESIPVYAYNDSKCEVIYREQLQDGVRRIVFKEDVIRGKMDTNTEEDGRVYWPHMRPSRTYYLVFSPHIVLDANITAGNVGTGVFEIHASCSFFGKFKTKDPMHVILDNADIEADLPIKAVCHGETTAFQFNLPALKVNKPIVDEAYCISDEALNGKVAPESQGTQHYKYEPKLNSDEVKGVITNLPYDWWMGGLKFDDATTYRGTIEDYLAAKHPTYKYDHNVADPSHAHTHAADYKKDGEPVDISLAMEDFRFFYPDFKEGDDWGALQTHDYDNDSGYSLLQSEINSIKDLVQKGIIKLHRNTYDMPLTYEEAEQLQLMELNDMMEKEMNDNILELALKLNSEQSIADKKPLKAIEGTVLDMISPKGKIQLTFEEYASFNYAQLQGLADKLGVNRTLPESELHEAVETVLRAKTDDELLNFAKNNFPDIGHEKRAYLVVRALNILSKETVAALPEADQLNSAITRPALRAQMIDVFKKQEDVVLRKMWADTSAELTEDERAALLKDNEHPDTPKNPTTMSADELAVLLENALAKITDNVISDMMSDRYVHFTLIPIMPSQENFVDEPYIFCPEPRGVKIRITSHEPMMLDGFADMEYPDDMTNVPIRLGLPQINETRGGATKTLRIPVRGLKKAAKDGVQAVKLTENTGYYNNMFLVKTDDPNYKQQGAAAGDDGLTDAKNSLGMYTEMVGTVLTMEATYPTSAKPTPDNYLVVKFNNGMNFREGYTYRVGVNFMEIKYVEENGVKKAVPTISCYGTMHLDLKVVPEYQKWTAATGNTDWTNDQNWARADRTELNAGNAASDGTKPLNGYITNDANQTSRSFVPMYFTNVLIDNNAKAPVLYEGLIAANHSERKFLAGLKASASDRIIYDMEVAPSTGAWHDSGNFECDLFGTYVADGITFKPASQLVNAQHLIYNKAWVEYELDVKRWYTLASPLQNTFAGEWYAPTNGGRQMTPHFYGIEYKHELNHRFQPAIYQRSWDSKGNNPVYLKQGGMQEAYIKADWSYVYNDVTKEYSEGGFSVKVADDFMVNAPEGSKALIRMPKADTKYTYYDINNATGQKPDDVLNVNANRSRLWTDKLKTDATFTQTITNVSDGNNFFLVGNPFMANMDMEKFFAQNEDLEKKLWIMSENGQEASVKVEGGQWIGTDVAGKVAPLQGFFVKAKDSSKTATLTFTADMQAEAGDMAVALKAKTVVVDEPVLQNLVVTAEREGYKSKAIVAVRKDAVMDYSHDEDCETFIDSNAEHVPTVYTVASHQAMTINAVPQIDMLPLGIICEEDCFVNVSFSGVESDLYLYDAQTNHTEKLTSGEVITLPSNVSGRYFISMKNTTGISTQQVKGNNGAAYDISGKRVLTQRCGTIVIVDGRKQLVK